MCLIVNMCLIFVIFAAAIRCVNEGGMRTETTDCLLKAIKETV